VPESRNEGQRPRRGTASLPQYGRHLAAGAMGGRHAPVTGLREWADSWGEAKQCDFGRSISMPLTVDHDALIVKEGLTHYPQTPARHVLCV
jgi:hypothetical protein